MTNRKQYRGVRDGLIPGLLVAGLMVLGLMAVLLLACQVEAAGHRSLFAWDDNNPPGGAELFRLRISATPGGAALQEVEIDAAAARAYEIPAPHDQGRNCGAEVDVQGEGVKTYYLRIRAEASDRVSDWSPEVSHTWNFLEPPGELIIIDLEGPTAELKVYRRLANGKRKRIFHYDGG